MRAYYRKSTTTVMRAYYRKSTTTVMMVVTATYLRRYMPSGVAGTL